MSLAHAGWFESNAIGKPFYSEQHSTLTKLELGFNRSYAEYDILQEKTTFERPMVEAHLGAEIPIYAYTKDRFVAMVAWPVSMHVLEDMFGSVTTPVINTDYRFGGPRFAIAKPLPWNYLRNISITWLPIFHECTLLGDEITIARME